MIRTAALIVLATLLAPAIASAGPPQRIVSLSLCTDQLVMLLAERERIASVSYLAADPSLSAMAGEARGLRLNHGLAEEILPLDPDLVLAGTFASRASVALLARLGRPVVELPPVNSLAEARARIQAVAALLGEEERGQELVDDMDAALAAFSPSTSPNRPRPRAALFDANGRTQGVQTLPGDVMRLAGLANLAEELGIPGYGALPLEALIALKPDLVVSGSLVQAVPSMAQEVLDHPALRASLPAGQRVWVPEPLWNCGLPQIVEAVALLAKAGDLAR